MAKPPRHHHYVPEFYLAGFTTTGTKDGTLYVHERNQAKPRASNPNATAHKRDYYAVDLGPGQDPMFVENKLAECEGKWAPVLRQIIERGTLPADDSFSDLLTFVAFLAVRIPDFRNHAADLVDRSSKAAIQRTLAGAEGRQHFQSVGLGYSQKLPARQRKQVEQMVRQDPQLQAMRDYANRGQYDVQADQTWHVQTMVQSALTLLPVLAQRRWSLWSALPDAPDLVCSDTPVCLTWANPNNPYLPGFGVRETLLTVPLNRRFILCSAFEPLATGSLDRRRVALMNTRTAMFATQLYSCTEEFVWLNEVEELATAAEWRGRITSVRA